MAISSSENEGPWNTPESIAVNLQVILVISDELVDICWPLVIPYLDIPEYQAT